jgi:hypothetical protein
LRAIIGGSTACETEEWRRQIGGDDVVPVLLREVDERRAALDAGVVHQDVDGAVLRDDRVDAGANGVLLHDVERGEIGVESFVAKRLGGLGERLGLPAVDDHGGAGLRHAARDRETETAIGAGDQRDAAGEVEGRSGHTHSL